MNLILIRDEELRSPDQARLCGSRARHLNEVLRVQAGQILRAGRPNGPRGQARVVATDSNTVDLDLSWDQGPETPPQVDLLLALPRPKVLGRILEHTTALGVGRLVLIRSWRVEKSYFQSDILRPDQLCEHLYAGLEMAGRTAVPRVEIAPRFRPFVEDDLDRTFGGASSRWLADSDAQQSLLTADLRLPSRQCLAIGPEGGFIEFEQKLLGNHGFEPVNLGDRTLRVETATTLALGLIQMRKKSGAAL